jgi:hypothetical protein
VEKEKFDGGGVARGLISGWRYKVAIRLDPETGAGRSLSEMAMFHQLTERRVRGAS